MSEFCSRIVNKIGSWWGTIGWFLFAGSLILPFLSRSPDAVTLMMIWMGTVLLLFAWWIIDLIDQQVEWWRVLIGMGMLACGVLPRGGLLIIACWVIYWMRVRE